MILDLLAQLQSEVRERAKLQHLLEELLEAKRGRKSEQLSPNQLALFEAAYQAAFPEPPTADSDPSDDDEPQDGAAATSASAEPKKKKQTGRPPLPAHLPRQQVVHDLADHEKHCADCHQDLRHLGDETSEHLEYIPASLLVIQHICRKYTCACTIRTATKPAQPIPKSNASASLLAQIIVSKCVDHLPLHRQEQLFARFQLELSRKTMGGWLKQCAKLLVPLYDRLKTYIWQSKVIGTDDTSVKVLDPELPFARIGRFWPYLGDAAHRAVIFDYTKTRARAGPEAFLGTYQGYLQADAYGVYGAFYKGALTEVACWAHARRYVFHARETDPARMDLLLLLISRLYRIEKEAAPLAAADRHQLRQTHARPILQKIYGYLLSIQLEVLPKSPAGRAVRYLLNQWAALNCYCDDGDLSIDNNATERSLRGIAIGRHNWTFLGSDSGGHTAAVLRSFTGSCQLIGVEPFAWFRDVLTRINAHPINRLHELLPHHWAAARP